MRTSDHMKYFFGEKQIRAWSQKFWQRLHPRMVYTPPAVASTGVHRPQYPSTSSSLLILVKTWMNKYLLCCNSLLRTLFFVSPRIQIATNKIFIICYDQVARTIFRRFIKIVRQTERTYYFSKCWGQVDLAQISFFILCMSSLDDSRICFKHKLRFSSNNQVNYEFIRGASRATLQLSVYTKVCCGLTSLARARAPKFIA